MPRINRRLRARLGGLSEAMRTYLLYGPILAPAPPANEAKAAFRTHRTEVMAENLGPGRRAYGHLVFDLGATPGRPIDNIDTLRERALIDNAEAIAIERTYPMLSPVPAEYGANLGSVERIAKQQVSAGVVDRWARNFAAGARWHRWRGRQEIGAYFEKCSLACQAWLAAQE